MSIALTRRPTNAALAIVLAAMDACWIFAAAWAVQQVILFGISPYPVPGPIVLALLWFAGWWLTSLAINSNLDIRVAQALTVLAGFLVTAGLLLALYPIDTSATTGLWVARMSLAAIVSMGVWALGSYRTTDSLDFNIAFKMFVVGLVTIGFSFLIASLLAGSNVGRYLSGVSAIPVWFVAASLLGMAMGNRELVRRETGSTDARFWTPVLVGCVLLVLLLSTLGGAFSLQALIDVIATAITWTVVIVAAVVYTILYFILSQFQIDLPRLQPPPGQEDTQPPQSQNDPLAELRRRFDEMDGTYPTLDLQNIFTIVAIVLVSIAVLAALFAVARRIRRTRQDRVKNLPEDRESFGSWTLLKQQVAQWWERLLSRLRRKPHTQQLQSEIDELAVLRGNPEWSGTLSVRQIYARLQSAATRRGYPRAPQQTPLEYLEVLSRAMPHLRADFAAITSAYIEARYSPLPASAPAVTSATQAWKHAEAELLPSRNG
jgi:hypothetical protein